MLIVVTKNFTKRFKSRIIAKSFRGVIIMHLLDRGLVEPTQNHYTDNTAPTQSQHGVIRNNTTPSQSQYKGNTAHTYRTMTESTRYQPRAIAEPTQTKKRNNTDPCRINTELSCHCNSKISSNRTTLQCQDNQ